MALAAGLITPSAPAAGLTPVALRCEYRVNPLGVDEAQPRLTWRGDLGHARRETNGLPSSSRFQRRVA